MKKIIVRYGEIGLKGQNRAQFEKQLVKNIRQSLLLDAKQVVRERGQIVVTVKGVNLTRPKANLSRVFGIVWFAEAWECESDLENIERKVVALLRGPLACLKSENITFAVRATRAYKKHEFSSKEIEEKIGGKIQNLTKAQVDLSKPEITVWIWVKEKNTYIFTKKIPGLGGLPVGTSGKVLVLLSGGFDSIAASYLLAKRGAQVDFLHFHMFPSAKQILETKIPKIWVKLSEYTLTKRVFLASYLPFQMAVLGQGKRQEKYELVMFRRVMVRVAEKLAVKHGYQALVLGDSLGQVASQTMENIVVVDQAVEVPIFRPLIGADKTEVIDLVRKMRLEKEAIEKYKDCCSIVADKPTTRANLKKVEQIEKSVQVDKVVDEIIETIEEKLI